MAHQVDSMLLCICSVSIDHRWLQDVIRTSVTHSAIAMMCATFFVLTTFLTSSMIRCTVTWNLCVKLWLKYCFAQKWMLEYCMLCPMRLSEISGLLVIQGQTWQKSWGHNTSYQSKKWGLAATTNNCFKKHFLLFPLPAVVFLNFCPRTIFCSVECGKLFIPKWKLAAQAMVL